MSARVYIARLRCLPLFPAKSLREQGAGLRTLHDEEKYFVSVTQCPAYRSADKGTVLGKNAEEKTP